MNGLKEALGTLKNTISVDIRDARVSLGTKDVQLPAPMHYRTTREYRPWATIPMNACKI